MRCILRGSKDHLVYDGEAVLHGRMSSISVRCILAMSYGDTKSTSGEVAEGEGLGCLDGGIVKGSGLVSLVRG